MTYATLAIVALSLMSDGQAEPTPLPESSEDEVVLFAFDSESIPFTQNLRLEMRQPTRHPANPVLQRGPEGSPDELAVQFYGSVIREGDTFRLWYVAADRADDGLPASAHWRPAYAESKDGIHWTKPNLGLVEYHGSKDNNLILTDPSPLGMVNLKVLRDDDDPDPASRYKITTHAYFRHRRRLGTLAPFVSADGLSWRMEQSVTPVRAELPLDALVLPPVHFEPCGGLYRWDGVYYINGQNAMNAPRPYQGRIVRTYRSRDFRNWSETSHIAFVRSTQHDYLGPGRSLEGEQNHEGISVWNRGNVLLGVYGRFHGAEEWKDVSVDLGLAISNDGLHFREPLQEWTFLERGADGEWDQGGVLQGQGFENVGDSTYIYYGAWDPRPTGKLPPVPRGGVGVAVLPRDRFGDLVVELKGEGPNEYQLPKVQCELITAPIPISTSVAPRMFLNADGLGIDSQLVIELLDENETPINGFFGDDAAVIRQSGFRTPITWPGLQQGISLPDTIHLKMTFQGSKRETIRFSALYIDP
ncbi:MAG: hypothetical protein KDA80_05090 [Planctomycetaceae bacterium]|nr:hypothetical protein [Planctomycetaceae bacterium]